MSYRIYTGVWTDWSRGPVYGKTITLSTRDGGFLLAFIATFVTFLAARTWRIVIFGAHQSLASGGKHDGLHYQRQFILRNTTSPTAATWFFFLQAWYWRKLADRAFLRTIPWVICGILYAAVFAIAAIFSSSISTSATEFRLLAATNCGIFSPADSNALQGKELLDNQLASTYSRQCYYNTSVASCKNLPVPSIGWSSESVGCPFADDICLGSKGFLMQTEWIDSHNHLGINAPMHNRIFYSRATVCSPLITQPGFAEFVNGSEARELGWDDNVLIKYLYGSRMNRDYTHIYNTYGQNMQTGYSTWPYYALASGNNTVWQPNEALTLERRDLTLLLIAPNSVVHREPNIDPVFGANIEWNADGNLSYLPDRFVSPVGCADGHRICNPNNGRCTRIHGSQEVVESAMDIGLNSVQLATVGRLSAIFSTSTFYHLTWTRTQSFLKAQELVAGLTQLPLPSNQWEIEMSSLFVDTLARLQLQTLEYVTGPSTPVRGTTVKPWDTFPRPLPTLPNDVEVSYKNLCESQRFKNPQGTVNFSVLGLSILLGLGFFLIICSFTLEHLTHYFQKKTVYGLLKAKRWERDESLQVMRMLFELKGSGLWKDILQSIPTTESKEHFEYDEDYLS
ncbi:hypothetical protein CCHL11_00915 [Colletotrichum chlorophyti]|uniref:Uncharacterized protein n=1 Tax=Colletotrichum chlorophyti TaxID=708187 RepID=A0A1Q8S584_9PEZI|nr:hypothetical protein CCHL11_00915 [Colletotrichum chlorophyti]